MKENSREKDEEILNNIKSYMQESIDNGYHKFIYNNLGYEEECIDVINAIDHILSDYKRLQEEFKAVDHECSRLERKEVEMEKIINLMTKYISNITDCPFESEGAYLSCEEMCAARIDAECWKKYFINKAKEVKQMSEEEKKAIEYFYNLRATIDVSNMMFDKDINVKCGKETIRQITIILNLINKLQKENERLKTKIDICNWQEKSCREIIESKYII